IGGACQTRSPGPDAAPAVETHAPARDDRAPLVPTTKQAPSDAAQAPAIAHSGPDGATRDAEPETCGRKDAPGTRAGRCIESPDRPIDPNEF
ncbi:MAG TPA: hypothetical protein VFZ61_23725, partial [Polyangiales bacterium]